MVIGNHFLDRFSQSGDMLLHLLYVITKCGRFQYNETFVALDDVAHVAQRIGCNVSVEFEFTEVFNLEFTLRIGNECHAGNSQRQQNLFHCLSNFRFYECYLIIMYLPSFLGFDAG